MFASCGVSPTDSSASEGAETQDAADDAAAQTSSAPADEVSSPPVSSIAPPTTFATTTTAIATTTTVLSFEEVLIPAPGDTDRAALPNAANGLAEALEVLAPGGTILLGPGTHPPLEIVGYVGDGANPLVIAGTDGAVVRGGGLSSGAAIRVTDSSHVVVSQLQAENALWGIMIESSEDIAVTTNVVTSVGQEAIRVKDGAQRVRIEGNTISETGLRTDISEPNGEGIYIGTGSPRGSDLVRDIEILNNEVFATRDEAIDIKLGVTNVLIADNFVHEIATATSGAIVVHLNAEAEAVDPAIFLERNIIRNVTRTSPYRDGNCIVAATTVTIVNNVMHGCQHRGIYLRGEGAVATILHNTLLDAGSEGPIVNEFASSLVLSQNNLGASGEANHAPISPDDLVDAAAGDYRPSSATQVPTTTPVIGVVEDLRGVQRPSGSVTFGAVEYAQSAAQ